jgi:hypothetical protein
VGIGELLGEICLWGMGLKCLLVCLGVYSMRIYRLDKKIGRQKRPICLFLIICGVLTSFERHLSLGIESRVFDDAFELYPTAIHELGKKIETHQVSDFFKKIQNSPTLYLFTKSTNPSPINSKITIKHSSVGLQRHHKSIIPPTFPKIKFSYPTTKTATPKNRTRKIISNDECFTKKAAPF